MSQKPKVVVIVGPTASGKTSLSIELAKKLNGEVISADSRQVYRGLDLGTGKVTPEEMQGVPHHLLSITDPKGTYTVTDFVRDGRTAITEILSRNKLPFIVGGTFLYTDALLGKISASPVPPNAKFREEMEVKTNEELFALLKEKDPTRAESIDKDNKRRLVRALEIIETLGVVPTTQIDEPYEYLIIGITVPEETLRKNIHERLLKRIDQGMIDEVISLQKNGLSYERMHDLGIEYRYISAFLQEQISQDEMLSTIETKTWQYAKRQMTWLKRDKRIVWVSPHDVEGIEKVVREWSTS